MTENKWEFNTLENGSACWVFDGGIGVGKSTGIVSIFNDQQIRDFFNEVIIIEEPIKKVTLDAYIHDKPKFATMFQIITLVKRIGLYEKAKRLMEAAPRRLVLIDRGLDGDQAFERMQVKKKIIDELGHKIYHAEIGFNDGTLEKWKSEPGFTGIYLRCTPETSWRRTLARGIEEEIKGYDPAYMEAVHEAHEEIFAESKAVVIDYDDDQKMNSHQLSEETLKSIYDKVSIKK